MKTMSTTEALPGVVRREFKATAKNSAQTVTHAIKAQPKSKSLAQATVDSFVKSGSATGPKTAARTVMNVGNGSKLEVTPNSLNKIG